MATPVLIIGAGLAGLCAGYLLQQRDIAFKLVEASSRLGGRILCQPHSLRTNHDYRVDLGPAWFWPHQREMIDLMQTLSVPFFEQYHQGEALFEAEEHTALERFAPSSTESFRVRGGMILLIEALAKKLGNDSIELDYEVKQIEQEGGQWLVECADLSKPAYQAAKVIIATPPRVIIDRLKLPDNALQPLKNELYKLPTWMAAQAKFVATYREAFWREEGLSGQAFSRQGPMVEIHDSSATEDDGFALFGFIGVPASHRQKVSTDELKRACLSQLVRIFGEQAMQVEETYLTDWATNALIASQADIDEQPNHPLIDLTPYQQNLNENGLYFGGSEVASRDAGYLQGAIVAATAAVEALNSI